MCDIFYIYIYTDLIDYTLRNLYKKSFMYKCIQLTLVKHGIEL